MPSSAHIAKVTRPVPAGYFPRRRLYRLLDKARKAPVLWVTGPPGCGKTALVSSYIESCRLPCLWYKVDEGDADLATFFYYLGLAAGKAAPRRKKRLPLLTPDRLPGLSVFAQRYFEDLSARLKVPSLIVFDDCHRLHDDSPFFETLGEGISRLAPGIGAIVISRNDPHPSFARSRANRLMNVLGWKDLRLTPEEAAGIVRLRRKGRHPPELVRDLFERTDGWAAGLVLLLERADTERVEPLLVRRQVPAEIIDYFGSEIFRRLDEERRAFLLRSAFLPRMTASMAERLTGAGRAGQILSDLNRQNLFTEKYLKREPVYEYHALFREFLLAQAGGAFSDEEFAEVRKRAAAVLEEDGHVEDAAGLLRQAADWEALARLILSQARSLVLQGRYQTLLEWLGALPKDAVDHEPWLLYWNGVGLMPFSQGESQAHLEAALHKFETRREAPGVFLAWSGVVDSILLAMNNYTPLDGWISLLPRLMERYGGLPAGEIGNRVTCSMFRALSFRQRPRADVKLWTPRALTVVRTSADTRLKVELGTAFVFAHQMAKGAQEAEISLASLREILKLPDTTPLMRLWVDAVDVVVSFILASHERVMRVASDGLAFAETTGVHFVDHLLANWGAMAALQSGDFESAKRFLGRKAAALNTMSPMQSSGSHFVAACEALHRKEAAKAVFHAKESLKQLAESGNTTLLPTTHLLAAHAHHALHEDEEATWHLAQARRIGSEIESSFHVWLSALTEAYFQLEGHHETSVAALLKEGLSIGRERGFFGTYLWRSGFFEKVAAKALDMGIEVDYVKELIRRNRLVPDPASPDLEQWPWPVKVYTLGRFELLADGRAVEFGRKVPQRPLSLLKALVALGGRSVPELRLAELLWPEADGDLAHQSFTIALNRLRKLLGKEEAVMLKEGRLSLSDRHCWVDAWAFERFLGQAERARKEGNRGEMMRLFERALSLYQGSFLPLEEMPWAVSPREKMRGGFLGAVSHLGRCFEELGRWEEAVTCYGKGIGVDDLAEELYRRLMVCHLRQGREAEARSVYRRCRRTLSSVLGVDPSAETQAVASSLGRSTS